MRQRLGWIAIGLLLAGAAEIALLVLVARFIGVPLTIVLVLATSLLGGWLLRREGIRAWRALRKASLEGRPPGSEVSDGLLGLLGGVLLLVPGFLTDLVGLALLLPPVRRGARVGVRRAAERRVPSAVAGDLFGPRRVRVRRGPPRSDDTPPTDDATPIEGEILDS
jgi:UPF0716 protein FxsA